MEKPPQLRNLLVADRNVKISAKNMVEIKKMYESIMSYASHGLFVREGEIIGRNIGAMILTNVSSDKATFFECASAVLKEQGWVTDIKFDDKVVVHGSAEALHAFGKLDCVCHRLRGIISGIYEALFGARVRCREVDCAAINGEKCVFLIER